IATVSGFSVDKGKPSGIINNGTLTLTNCIVLNNGGGAPSGKGAGIDNLGTLTIQNCTITHNTALDVGGGLYNNGSTTSATLTDVVFSFNSAVSGGAIQNEGTLNLNNVDIANNTATNGAGVFSYLATNTFSNVTFDSNFGANGGGFESAHGS